MSILRRWVALMLGLLLTLGLPGCSLSAFKQETARVPEYITSILSEPKTFNFTQSQESPNIFGLTYEGLVDQNPLTSEFEPALAESWQVSADKLNITFTLRPDLKWSDGQPLTVDDVLFTYNDVYLNEAVPTDARDILRMGEDGALPILKKIDQRRVQFTVPEPFAPFLSNTSLPILPAHALRELVTTKDQQGKLKFIAAWGVDTPVEQIIVNGAYKLDRFETGQRVIFRRNPYYWRYQTPTAAQGNIERIVWQVVESTDTALLQFRSGGSDSEAVSPENFSLLKREAQQRNFTIYEGGPASGTSFLFFNLNQGRRNNQPLVDPIKSRWFNNVKFRQAVAYAIDRQTMLNNTYQGLGTLQNSPISVQSPYYASPEEGIKVYDYDPQRARQLLQSAGFKYNAKQELEDAEGNRVRFTLMTNAGNKVREALGAQVQRDLATLGIQVDYTPIAFSTLVDKLSESLTWDCTLLGLTGGVEPNGGANVWNPEGGLHMFNQKPGPQSAPIQGHVISDWERAIGDLYVQGARELDEAQRQEIYAKTQQIAQEQLPFIYLINALSLAAVRNDIEGVQFSALGGVTWNIHDLKNVNAALQE
ncbi:MAG: ABC transporter substrate-binding protein [Acaryochloridaceae cyanobacterium SU_2_1]|nr:ABC transporter substrate-binding protein [Acaryochloridaceae cyanobacterium SU_2_1]